MPLIIAKAQASAMPAPATAQTTASARVARNESGVCPITHEPLSGLPNVYHAEDDYKYCRPALRLALLTSGNKSPIIRIPMPKDYQELVTDKFGPMTSDFGPRDKVILFFAALNGAGAVFTIAYCGGFEPLPPGTGVLLSLCVGVIMLLGAAYGAFLFDNYAEDLPYAEPRARVLALAQARADLALEIEALSPET